MYDSAVSALSQSIEDLWTGIGSLGTWVEQYGTELAQFFDVTGGDLVTWVQDEIYAITQDAVNAAADTLGFAYNALNSLVNGALSSIDELFTIVHGIDQDVIDLIQASVVSFGEYVWNTYLEPIIGPIEEAVDWIEAALEQLGEDAWDTITTTIDLVTRAEEWLVWMAEHSFDDLTQLWGSVSDQTTLAWIEQQAADPNGYVDQWAEDLANLVNVGTL